MTPARGVSHDKTLLHRIISIVSSSRDPHTRCDRASREDETWRGALSVRRARLRPTALDDRSLSALAGSVGRRRCLSGG
ncbi:unnamed protein product, partial [Brenthis ino]